MKTKLEIVKMLSELYLNIPALYNKRLRKLMRLDDHLFIPWVKENYGFRLIQVRRNLYEVTI